MRGGPLSHLQVIAPHVARLSIEVCVLCANERVAEGFRESGVEAVAVPLRDKLDVGGAAAAWRHLRADIVHTHDRRTGLLVRPPGRARGARVVHTLHGLPEEIALRVGREDRPVPPGVSRARLTWLVQGYLRIEALLGSLGTIVVPSRAMRDFLVDHGFSEHRVRVIPSGVTVRETTPAPRPPSEPAVVGTTANLEYWKGIDVLLEACGRIGRTVRLEVFGDGSLRSSLEAQARRLGLDARFHGFVDDLPRRLDDLDLFVLPSRGDNFPIAILEAMSSGLPVIGTRVGGIPELVVDGETGLLVEPGDVDGMAAALDDLLADPARRGQLGRNGAVRVARRFAAADSARRFVELYEELCRTR